MAQSQDDRVLSSCCKPCCMYDSYSTVGQISSERPSFAIWATMIASGAALAFKLWREAPKRKKKCTHARTRTHTSQQPPILVQVCTAVVSGTAAKFPLHTPWHFHYHCNLLARNDTRFIHGESWWTSFTRNHANVEQKEIHSGAP